MPLLSKGTLVEWRLADGSSWHKRYSANDDNIYDDLHKLGVLVDGKLGPGIISITIDFEYYYVEPHDNYKPS